MTSPTAGSPKSPHDSRQRLLSHLLSCDCRVSHSSDDDLWGYVGGRRSRGKPRLRRSFAKPCDVSDCCPGLAIPFIRVILHTIGFLARRTRSSIG